MQVRSRMRREYAQRWAAPGETVRAERGTDNALVLLAVRQSVEERKHRLVFEQPLADERDPLVSVFR